MSYGGCASSVISKKNDLSFVVINVNNLGFDNVWKSNASQKLLTSLKDVLNKINKENSNLNTFANAIKRIDECIEIDRKISELENSLFSLDEDDEDYEESVEAINIEIGNLKQDKDKIKNEIKAALSGIGAVDSSVSMLYSNTADFDYICDVRELHDRIKGCREYAGNVANLYKDVQYNGLSGMDFINSQLDGVKKSYTGREAAVNSVLMSLMLAADKNVKYTYTNSGANQVSVPYNTNSQMVDGMDCCAYVSWAVNKGTAEPFHWEGVGGFNGDRIGDEIDISQALPGDVLVNNKHVAMIIANDPETGQVTFVEAGGSAHDVHLMTLDYNKLRISFTSGDYPKVKSMEDYYTGAKSNAKK